MKRIDWLGIVTSHRIILAFRGTRIASWAVRVYWIYIQEQGAAVCARGQFDIPGYPLGTNSFPANKVDMMVVPLASVHRYEYR